MCGCEAGALAVPASALIPGNRLDEAAGSGQCWWRMQRLLRWSSFIAGSAFAIFRGSL